jgi:hypothetical protein
MGLHQVFRDLKCLHALVVGRLGRQKLDIRKLLARVIEGADAIVDCRRA